MVIFIEKKQKKTILFEKPDNQKQKKYLVQLIEHPILRIPNFLFAYFLSLFFQIKVLN